MAKTGHLHWVGAFLLLVAAILLLIASITAPVINNLSLLTVDLPGRQVSYGSFGYCILGGQQGDFCSAKHIGYKPAEVITDSNLARFDIADGLTGAMVLHPVACALAFIAFLVSMASGVVGSLVGFIIAGLAWVLTLVVMAIDFTLFAVIRNHVNDAGQGYSARYGSGMWCVLAAFILLFLGGLIVLFTCCSARNRKRHDRRVGAAAVSHHEHGHGKTEYGAPARRGGRFSRFRRH